MYTISQDPQTGEFYVILNEDKKIKSILIDLEEHDEDLTPRTIVQRDEHEDFLFDLYLNYNKSYKFLIKEYDVSDKRKHDLLYTNKTHQLVTGFFSAVIFGFWSVFRLVRNLLPNIRVLFSNGNSCILLKL